MKVKTYFICNEDNFGQRTGTYYKIELKKSDIEYDRIGLKMYKGKYLFDKEIQALRAALS